MADSIQTEILALLEASGEITSIEIAAKLKEEHQKVVGALKSINCFDGVIEMYQVAEKRFELSDEGREVMDFGSHEVRVFRTISASSRREMAQTDVVKTFKYASIGISKALANKWIKLRKLEDGSSILSCVEMDVTDKTRIFLNEVISHANDVSDTKLLNECKKRKLLVESKITLYKVAKGAAFTRQLSKSEVDLTAEMIQTGSWRTTQFKPYNLNAKGQKVDVGHLHPLLKVRAAYRQIFLEMGFKEMPTNNFVESSFWNFDALFQPQQHPARDAHDTFFLTQPSTAKDFPGDYLKRVAETHSKGGYGSLGYSYDWRIEEAEKNVLRTHTTAVSARMLYALANKPGGFEPVKYFSIDRVFRNETLDATHLAEFHQIEGVVADYNLTLGNLMGIIKLFFEKLGIKKLRFKPAMNPYTEPSMEVFSFHEGLNKWVEIGNSGIFRPEMLEPMGLPPDVVVIAWGLSLERPTMIKYGIDNIRDLIGPKVNLQMIYDNPICRLTSNSKE